MLFDTALSPALLFQSSITVERSPVMAHERFTSVDVATPSASGDKSNDSIDELLKHLLLSETPLPHEKHGDMDSSSGVLSPVRLSEFPRCPLVPTALSKNDNSDNTIALNNNNNLKRQDTTEPEKSEGSTVAVASDFSANPSNALADLLLSNDAAIELLHLLAKGVSTPSSTVAEEQQHLARHEASLPGSSPCSKEEHAGKSQVLLEDNLAALGALFQSIRLTQNSSQELTGVSSTNIDGHSSSSCSGGDLEPVTTPQAYTSISGSPCYSFEHCGASTPSYAVQDVTSYTPNPCPLPSHDKTTITLPLGPRKRWTPHELDLSMFLPDGSLNLELFKVFPCTSESFQHDRKNCPFYHSQRDRRRHPSLYRAEQCDDHFDLDDDYACACPRGDACNKCHNRHELLYHPAIYKQRFCSSYSHALTRPIQCHRGQFCAFAHTRSEIRCQLFAEVSEREPHTFWCPYGTQHDWHGCLYAHTYQDCRRSPKTGYGSEPCPYWQKDLHSVDYRKRCPYGTRCPYSHGSKEQLYHPAYYKTMPCADYKAKRLCPRGHLCAFYHDLSEKRITNQVGIDGLPYHQQYNYTKPLPAARMAYLQKNFRCPPLFNLDDFEAFGHTSRLEAVPRASPSPADLSLPTYSRTGRGTAGHRSTPRPLVSCDHPTLSPVTSYNELQTPQAAAAAAAANGPLAHGPALQQSVAPGCHSGLQTPLHSNVSQSCLKQQQTSSRRETGSKHLRHWPSSSPSSPRRSLSPAELVHLSLEHQ